MPRQPLLTKYPDARPTFGPGFLEDRPKAAAIIARCIALWTEIEVSQARVLATMLRANTEPAVALFLAIHNSRIQRAVMDAVAKVALNDDDYRLYAALMRYSSAVEKERNALAHGNFGRSTQIEDAVVWIDALDYVRFGRQLALEGSTEETIAKHDVRRHMFVYELSDLETVARDMEHLHKHLGFFIGYMDTLHSGDADRHEWRAKRYPELCSEPRIARELSRLQGRQETP